MDGIHAAFILEQPRSTINDEVSYWLAELSNRVFHNEQDMCTKQVFQAGYPVYCFGETYNSRLHLPHLHGREIVALKRKRGIKRVQLQRKSSCPSSLVHLTS